MSKRNGDRSRHHRELQKARVRRERSRELRRAILAAAAIPGSNVRMILVPDIPTKVGPAPAASGK
ncbi:MAG: hypothetical protein ACKV2V_00495 [Blastocatellia bacterium]